MYLDGAWHAVTLAPATSTADAADRLDVARLHDQVLAPLLQIGDIRDGQADRFRRRNPRHACAERLVDDGQAAVAFAMHPVGIADLMAIADAGGIMPPEIDLVRAEAARWIAEPSDLGLRAKG